ncbi:MAG: YggS family pyridoxal phosphate-dependent enzyme [Bacteroidales bacterium]|nr:YggS family pyridoxal phosphate-dependent enzyme [Bacteroidales bacterium]
MDCVENYQNIKKSLPENVLLLAVSKTKPNEDILKLYNIGCRDFGENKVQEMTQKHQELPKDIRWHQIGHLQTNKIKYIIDFVYMIHSVDSLKLLQEINRQAEKHSRIVDCLLQVKVAQEDTKFGLSFQETENLFQENVFEELKNIRLRGLMAMATNTDDVLEIQNEFLSVKNFYNLLRIKYSVGEEFNQISMGMSEDYPIAIENSSTIVRLGSVIFGQRDYSNQNKE